MEHLLPYRLCDAHHLVGALGGAADAEACIAAAQHALGDRMKDLGEDSIADRRRAGRFDQRQRQRFARDRQMAGAEERQRRLVHRPHVGGNPRGIVVGA